MTADYEVIEEYTFRPQGTSFVVNGRVSKLKSSTLPYRWEISHYYAPPEQAEVYHPSKVSFATFDEAKQALNLYAKPFTNYKVTQNPEY